MTSAEITECMDVARAAVEEAGPIALEYFRTPMDVENKLDGGFYDPVTQADKQVESKIRERLGAAYPDHRIIGEEHGDTGSGDTYWIIDPIDGTRAFISGMPMWGVLLGLVVDGKAVAGIMHQPFTQETYWGTPEGAWLDQPSGRRTLTARKSATLSDSIVASTHPDLFFDSDLSKRYTDLSTRCRLQRWGGDCYGFALVALGTLDLMIDGMLMPYDIVPLIPIIEGAGGVVTNLAGESPLGGGTVIAAANADVHAEAMAIMNGTDAG